MTTHAATKIDQKEYLKKYLSGDLKDKKKKKKDKKKLKHSKEAKRVTVKIIDDDISAADGGPQIDEELLLTGDDAPQIVGEYVEDGKIAAKWRSITIKEEIPDSDGEGENVRAQNQNNEAELWGRKAIPAIKIKNEFSPSRHRERKQSTQRQQITPDNSPLRRRRKEKDISPSRRTDERERRSSNSAERSHRHKSSKASATCRWSSPPANSNTDRREHKCKREKSPSSRRKEATPDQSPPRRRDSDQSPPRKGNHGRDSNRRRDSDQSPPRKRTQSPRRRRRESTDQSPPRRRERRKHSSSSNDQSPQRRRQPSLSPSRIKREPKSPPIDRRNIKIERSPSPPRYSSHRNKLKRGSSKSPSPPPTHKPKQSKTLDGKKAGLQDAKSLQIETDQRRRQEERMFEEMSKDMSGRDAEVRVRSTGRRGKRARDAQAEDPEERRRREEREQKTKQQYERWGKGLKQIEEHRNRIAADEYESNKPLARYANDEDLDRHLREQERADDPMLEYMRQRRKEKSKDSNVPKVPVYEGSYPENRFGIRPGYRWDGVDRSNGYEKRWFEVQNEKRAVQEEAYKYSVEDM